MIGRREFLGLAGAAATFPSEAFAQQRQSPTRIAYLTSNPADLSHQAFRDAMSGLGYVEGKDFVIQSFNAPTTADAPTYAAMAVATKPDVIVANGSPSSLAAKSA